MRWTAGRASLVKVWVGDPRDTPGWTAILPEREAGEKEGASFGEGGGSEGLWQRWEGLGKSLAERMWGRSGPRKKIAYGEDELVLGVEGPITQVIQCQTVGRIKIA